jgi:hypothetical protein
MKREGLLFFPGQRFTPGYLRGAVVGEDTLNLNIVFRFCDDGV